MDNNDDQMAGNSRKRVRRNALKPNSAEAAALREFSLLHTLKDKLDITDKRARVETEKEELAEHQEAVDEKGPETDELNETDAIVSVTNGVSSSSLPAADNKKSPTGSPSQLSNNLDKPPPMQ